MKTNSAEAQQKAGDETVDLLTAVLGMECKTCGCTITEYTTPAAFEYDGAAWCHPACLTSHLTGGTGIE